MSSVQQILHAFDRLSPREQAEVADEILRRISLHDLPPLDDSALIHLAGERFLELDRDESAGKR